MGELAPGRDSHAIVVVIMHPSIRLDGIWTVLGHVG